VQFALSISVRIQRLPMFPRKRLHAFIILGAALLLTACSSTANDRTHLSGPYAGPYKPVHSQTQKKQYSARQVQPANCINEPVAPRPFPPYAIVARGENLCRIARRYQTTVQAIVDINRLPSPILAVGTRLNLPSPQYFSHQPFGKLRHR